jgi:5-methylcytosine-specific restriction endonuclease McrA
MKLCANKGCNETDPERFNKNKSRKDGLSQYCRSCANAITNKWGTANPDKKKECGRVGYKKFYDNNRDKELARLKKSTDLYRANNPEKIKEGLRVYRQNNPDIINAQTQRRNAKRLSLPVDWSARLWKQCLDFFGNRCVYCHRDDLPLEQDHFIPLNDPQCPGTVPWNMVPACRGCNSRKNDNNPFTWESKFDWIHFLIRICENSLVTDICRDSAA